MSEDIKFRKTDNNQTIAIKEGEVVGGAGTSVGPDKLPTFDVFKKQHEGLSPAKIATKYVQEYFCRGIKGIDKPAGLPCADRIIFTSNGAKETGRAITDNKMLVLPYVADIYRTGAYVGSSSKTKDKHTDVERFHYTRKEINVSGKKLVVTVCSKEMKERVGPYRFRHYLIDKSDAKDSKENSDLSRPSTRIKIRSLRDKSEAEGILIQRSCKDKEGEEIYEFVDLEVEEVKKNNRSIAFDSVSVRSVDANGFLHVERSPLTRVQVAPYLGREISGWQAQGLDPERMYHAYRPPEELSSAETIKSINGIPIHLEHHDDAGEPEDKKTRVGTTGTDGAFNAPFLMNSLHIFDQDAINRINDGSMKELSLAYTYIPEFKSGVTDDGEKYDFIQRQIRANHLALVENGRAGPSVKVSDSGKEINMADIENKDAGTEQKEVDLAQKIIDLHKVDENGHVVDASDEDKEAAITKILDELKDKGMSDEDLKKMKDTLSDLAYSKATGDEAPDSEMKKGEAEDDDEELDEKMKNPNFKSGFEAGVRYGEKREKDDPKRIDRDHEREGEERYLHEVEDALKSCGLDDAPDEVKDAFKEGYKFTAKEAEDDGEEVEETGEKVEEKVKASDSLKALKSALIDEMTAIEEVKPVVGAIRLGAYDSAGQVYMAALKKLGISGVSASQARIAYRAYIVGRQGSIKSTARDSAPKESRTALTQILEKVN
ncbi:DUF2213 domain-containing protein [uncultured Parasutterella sp.]|uniref:DUF2213 domain-containing protein n=2 Tax=uncultured Parasutterella sp. TaxID=1263098 RepID=UPI0025A654FC|nr:DUF2213 domain-containing protein [uncultured Parasutterella sp.]